MQETIPQKIPKGSFKCFHCRKLFAMKDGEWRHWGSMEVHLCKGCDKSTKDHKERGR